MYLNILRKQHVNHNKRERRIDADNTKHTGNNETNHDEQNNKEESTATQKP